MSGTGDYISREALLERIDNIWDCADLVFEPNDHCCRTEDCASCKWAETKNAIRKIIANFPAADVRPVVRLYGAAQRAAQALGYKRIVTYTLQSENGASLRASNWICDGQAGGTHWTGQRYEQTEMVLGEMKVRWRKEL